MSATRAPAPLGARLGSSLPDFALSALCFVAWINPAWVSPWVVPWLLLTMLLEFFVVHATGILGAVACTRDGSRGEWFMISVLVGFYTLFVGLFSWSMHSWTPLASFWLLMLNRLSGVMLHRSGNRDDYTRLFMMAWASSTAIYLLSVACTTAGSLPRLGFSPAFVASLHLEGGGLWIDEPWRAVAGLGVYFALVGLMELFVFGRIRPREDLTRPPADAV